jgi:glycosyltransferase involved in cell wall biosynthesis
LYYTPGFNAAWHYSEQVLTLHDLMHLTVPGETSRIKRFYYERVVRPAVRSSGVVLTVSSSSADAIANWLDDPNVDVIDVGNGCSDAFKAVPHVDEDERGSYILYVGNCKPHKNVSVMFDAARHIPDMRVVVITSDVEECQLLAHASGVADRLVLRTSVSDVEMASLYANAVALVMPSLIEGFGLPALESLRCGTPVVYFQGCQSVREIVGDGGIGVNSRSDGVEWADGIVRAAAIRVMERWCPTDSYEWDSVAAKVESVLVNRMM